MFNTDYIVIGSIGFAQVGTNKYSEKEEIEKKVIQEIVKKEEIFKIPTNILDVVRLVYKRFNHDFGEYFELCVVYNEELLDLNEDLEVEFYKWVNQMEEFDFESEEIMERCNELYREEFSMTVIKGGKDNDDDINNLKIV